MKKTLFLLIILLLVNSESYSQHKWLFKGGTTYSSLKNGNDVEPITGYIYGVGREWHIYKSFHVALEYNYLHKGGILKNKTIRPLSFSPYQDVYLNNIERRIAFIEIPLIIKYSYQFNAKISSKVYGGVTYSIPMYDKTKIKKKAFLYTADPLNDNHTYDYSQGIESGFGGNLSEFAYIFGIEFYYSFIGIDFRYTFDNRKYLFVDSISEIYKNIHTFHLMINLSI